jgi:hypothetical protein
MLDVIVIIIFFLLGLNFKKLFPGFNPYDKKILTYLFFYHLIFGVAYYFFALSNAADATVYWNFPKDYGLDAVKAQMLRDPATGYIYLINYFPSNILDLSFFTGFVMYSVLGYFGFVFFYKIVKENIAEFNKIRKFKIFSFPVFPYLLFLPNLQFWTSGIGKDTIIFFCCMIFIYALNRSKKRLILIIISFIVSLLIRPHILLFLLMGVGVAAFLDKRLKAIYKIMMVAAFVIGSVIVIPYVLNLTGMESLQAENFENFVNKKASDLGGHASSSVDINSYPYPLKVFTFLFRPLFFDATNILGFVASIENFIYLILFLKVIRLKPVKRFSNSPVPVKTAVVFFAVGCMIFPLLLGNLGIILREKTPFMIMFLLYSFYLISVRKNAKQTMKMIASNV